MNYRQMTAIYTERYRSLVTAILQTHREIFSQGWKNLAYLA